MIPEIKERIWGDKKTKYEVVKNYVSFYTCVSLRPRHEVLEILSNRYKDEKEECIVYIVNTETHERKAVLHINSPKKIKELNCKKIPVFDIKTGDEYSSIMAASMATGISRSAIVAQCQKNNPLKTRFSYINKDEK